MNMRFLSLIFGLVLINITNGQKAALLKHQLELELNKSFPVFHSDGIIDLADSILKSSEFPNVLGRYNYFNKEINDVFISSNLPWYLTVLPVTISSCDLKYHNVDSRSGYWGLLFNIGKKYGLKQTALYDERRDLKKSTEVAVKHIKGLENIYLDWRKTIAAYIIGPARLNQVIHGSQTLEFDELFNELSEDEQIQIEHFYASVLAVTYAKEKNSPKPVTYTLPNSKVVKSINQNVPIGILEKHLEINQKVILDCNPAFKTAVIPYLGFNPIQFKLPMNVSESYLKNIDSIALWIELEENPIITYDTIEQVIEGDTVERVEPNQEPEIEENQEKEISKAWVYYTVKRGDGLYTLNDIFGCTTKQIRDWNNVPRGMFLITGKVLKFEVDSDKLIYYKSINEMTQAQKRAEALKN